jgi:hypothetical protein
MVSALGRLTMRWDWFNGSICPWIPNLRTVLFQ